MHQFGPAEYDHSVPPKPEPYSSWGGSRSQIDTAGRCIRDYWVVSPHPLTSDVVAAFDIAWKYRAEFQTPLTSVVMGLRSFVKSEGAPVVVAQRLKRMPTILDKLGRHSAMQLTRMQDIGGCRAVFPQGGFAYIEGVRRRMRRQHWDVVEEYDYITTPKLSGYRGIHVVVRRQNRLVEIQLRTEAQHRWAETVEQLGSRTGHNLKDGQGPKELLQYLERAAYGTSLQELGQPLPNHFRTEFAELAERAQPFLVRR